MLFNKTSRITLILLLSCGITIAQQGEHYSRVKIYTDSKGLATLAEAGIAVDHGDYKRGVYFTSDFSAKEISIIKEKGFRYEVLIEDVKAYYVQQNKVANKKKVNESTSATTACFVEPRYKTPTDFSLGSMAGFFTYDEAMAHLDNMAAKYPNLIKAKQPIGNTKTNEGRPIYYLKISDNPNIDENEPRILYTALHHAREPASLAQVIMYMYYLLENYNTNAEVKYLMDNTEMYFVPMINPDGYIYNQTTDPQGGGLWRKNRRDNGDGTMGVDLNRNYGYFWGRNDLGSSPNGFSETFRGASSFSEPETQTIRDFCIAKNFKITLNYHTFSNVLIYPWGYDYGIYTPDSATFSNYAGALTKNNHYTYGTCDQTLSYTANGTSDDWMYGEQAAKGKIFAFTPEAGLASDGFWPPESKIINICKENIYQNLTAVKLLLKYAKITDTQASYLPANGTLHYSIQRLGLDNAGTYTVNIKSLSNALVVNNTVKTYSNLLLLKEAVDSIPYTITAGTAAGSIVQYEISLDNGQFVQRDTISKRFGKTSILFSTNCNSFSGWTSSTGWDISSQYYFSPSASITDSPSGPYADNTESNVTTSNPTSLKNITSAELSFAARWEVESRFDFVEAQISTDNVNWTPLCGKYTKPGNAYQHEGAPVYDGYKQSWVKEKISLDDYLGQNVWFRFILETDGGGQPADGYYFDDFKIETIDANNAINALEPNANTVKAYPNPATNELFVNYQLAQYAASNKIKVYNSLGVLVMDKTLSNNDTQTRLDISNLSAGIYTYLLESGIHSSTPQKLIIIR